MNISNQTHNLKCILRLLRYGKYYNVSLQGVAYTPLFAQFLAYKALVFVMSERCLLKVFVLPFWMYEKLVIIFSKLIVGA